MATDTRTELASQPLLQSLPASIAVRLATLPVMELPGGTQVFETRMRCGGFPVVLSGAVRVIRHLANGRRIEIYRVTPDEACILSIGCLLGGAPYPASGITSGPTRIVVMPPALFNECLAAGEAFRTAIFRTLGSRLVHAMELLEEIATLRLDARLALALLEHDRTAAGPDGERQIAVTHQELADELGTVREMVSRLLDDFAGQGMVALGRGRIRICDAQRLRAVIAARQ